METRSVMRLLVMMGGRRGRFRGGSALCCPLPLAATSHLHHLSSHTSVVRKSTHTLTQVRQNTHN